MFILSALEIYFIYYKYLILNEVSAGTKLGISWERIMLVLNQL
jgi:hypothetical protein